MSKTTSPSSLKFRPISCCNTIYKCIAKIIANHVAVVLPSLIGKEQLVFVLEHQIPDNILLAQDLVHAYQSKKESPHCAFKVDLRKAFIQFSGLGILEDRPQHIWLSRAPG